MNWQLPWQTCMAALMLAMACSAQTPTDKLEEPQAKAPWWVRGKTALSPEVEKRLEELANRMVPKRREALADHLANHLKEVVTAYALSDSAKATLEEAAKKAVDESIKPFKQAVTEINRIRLPDPDPKEALEYMKQWNPEGIGQARLVLGCRLPDRQQVWIDALQKTLSPEQFADWQKKMAAKVAKRDGEIAAMIKPWVNQGRQEALTDIKSWIDELSTAIALEAASTEELKKKAEAIIERICKDETDRVSESQHFIVDKRWANESKPGSVFKGYTLDASPAEDAEWIATLKTKLNDSQRLAWFKHQQKEGERLDKELTRHFAPLIDRREKNWTIAMEEIQGQIKAVLNLPEKRAKEIEELAKKAVAKSVAIWMETNKSYLLKLPASGRRAMLKNNQEYSRNITDAQQPQNLPLWKDNLKKLLSEEEHQKLAQDDKNREERQKAAFGQMMLMQMDVRLALTQKQRESLTPITLQRAESLRSQVRANSSNQYWSFSQSQILQRASTQPHQDFRSILDDVQWKHFEKMGANTQMVSPQLPVLQTAVANSAVKPELPDVETQISEYFYQAQRIKQKELLSIMLTRVEDAQRVLSLPEAKVIKLTTAAKGAVEFELSSWKLNIDSYVRSQLRDANPGNVQALLPDLNRVSFGNRNIKDDAPIWKKTTEALISPEQLKIWQTELKAREDYKLRSIAEMTLMEMDRRVRLSSEQFQSIRGRLVEVLKEYLPDMHMYMSDTWYLQYYSVVMPLAGIPEKELKTILQPSQWKAFEAELFPRSQQYWSGIEEYHNQRVRSEKKATP